MKKKLKIVLFYNMGYSLTRAFIIIGTALITKNVKYVFIALVIFQFLRTLTLVIYLIVNYHINIFSYSVKELKPIISYSAPLGLGAAIGNIGRNFESYLITYILSPVQFAIYSVAIFRVPYTDLIYSSVADVAVLKVSEFANNSEGKNNIIELWRKVIVKLSSLIIPSILFFQVVAFHFITFLFGDIYADSVSLFRIVILASLVPVFAPAVILRAFNKTAYMFRVDTVIFTFGLVFGFFMIKILV
ncbi:MAG: oligosaccharide flippase family protein [Bacteroidales bacterium]|nr:oligosaccharide flippase family protein [Bacteroidales bacterium]